MISGIIRISRALHGQVTPFVFVAAPLALAMPWQWGLVNYWLSAGLAFHAFATWVAADINRWSAMRRAAVFAVVTPIIWLSHAYGWAIFLVLVFSYEITRMWSANVRDLPKVAGQLIIRIWPAALPIVLTLIWQHGREGAETSGFFYFRHKLHAFTYVLRDQNIVVDIISQFFILCVLLLIYLGYRRQKVLISSALAVAVVIFAALVLILPHELFGSYFTDDRLWPIVLIMALTAACPCDKAWRLSRTVAGIAVGLFAIRMVVMAHGFIQYNLEYQSDLRALDHIPEGASIAILTPTDCGNLENWRWDRLEHLGSLAIVRKRAFVNSQFSASGAQLLLPLRALGTEYNSDPSELLPGRWRDCSVPVEPLLGKRILDIPRDRFDYVWLINFDARSLPGYAGLVQVYANERSSLYRLSRESSSSSRHIYRQRGRI